MKKLLLPLLLTLGFLTGCVAPEMKLRVYLEETTPLKVAAMLPVSGKNRIYAEQMREGLIFAAEEINANGGINKRKLQLEILDTCGTAAGTRAAIDKAIALNTVAIIAGYDTKEVGMIISNASALRMPTVIPLATSDYHVQESPFVYRNCYSDAQQMEVLAAYLHYWRNLRRGALLIDPVGDLDYSRSVARDLEQSMKDQGDEVVYKNSLPQDGSLPQEFIRDILATDPQFVFVPASGKRIAQILKALRNAGFNGIICGPDSWDDTEFIAELVDTEPGDCIYTAFFSKENTSAEYEKFSKDFRAKYFHQPDACSTQSYDALKFLAIGLSNADNLHKFDRNWRTIRNHAGAAAVYTMLKKGDIDRTVYLNSIGVYRGKRLIPYARLSKKLQYSKIQDYRITESPEKL